MRPAVHSVRQLITDALLKTRAALRTAPNFGVYLHAEAQLLMMLGALESLDHAFSTRDKVDIDLMAVRELVDEEPELATALMKAADQFKQLQGKTPSP